MDYEAFRDVIYDIAALEKETEDYPHRYLPDCGAVCTRYVKLVEEVYGQRWTPYSLGRRSGVLPTRIAMAIAGGEVLDAYEMEHLADALGLDPTEMEGDADDGQTD